MTTHFFLLSKKKSKVEAWKIVNKILQQQRLYIYLNNQKAEVRNANENHIIYAELLLERALKRRAKKCVSV